MKICIFGAASAHIDDIYIKKVEELGEMLAKRGHSLVFGGGAYGLMGAVSRGFKTCNGRVTAVLPKFFKDEEIEETSANCDEVIFTESMSARKTLMEDLSDAFLILPGGLGTLEEMFEVFTLLQLGRHKKPITIMNLEGFYDGLKDFLQTLADKKFVTQKCINKLKYFTSPDALMEYLENYESGSDGWRQYLYEF